MEYIKKEELKDGDVFVSQMSHNHFLNKYGTGYSLHLNLDNTIKNQVLYRSGGFAYNNMRLATPEEKHWLNECIKLDKFIIFEEAMKTFIPEYVEVLDTGCRITGTISSGKIYKCSKDVTKTYHYGFFLDSKHIIGFNKNEFDQYLKPSTKEAYDAQFIVKEPEFVLPKIWWVRITKENLKDISKFLDFNLGKYTIGFVAGMVKSGISGIVTKGYNSTPTTSYGSTFGNEITFEQFKKYVLKEEIVEEKVIEPLPQFKVIETIETITKVENNEGNQFFIGDKVITPLNNNIIIISSFTYNQDKTELYANFKETLDVININKIEHYIEPKTDYKILEYKTEGGISCKAPFLADSHQFYINERCKIYSIKRISDDLIITVGDEVLGKTCGVPNKILSIELINNKIRLYPRNSFYNLEDIIKVKDETLLEKAKRLYPIGTKFKVACNPKYTATVKDHNDYPFQDIDIVNLNTEENIDGCTGMTVFYKGKWAEIINE